MQLGVSDVPAVILAGGQGRRIGGRKAEVVLAGKPLWRHVVDRIEPQAGLVALNGLDVDGFDGIPDAVPGLGPLGGILAAMIWAKSLGADRVMTVSVDTPFLPTDLLSRLAELQASVVMAETSDGTHGTTALWSVDCAPALQAALDSGVRKVTQWSESQGAERVMFEDTHPPSFFNINTAQDLAQAEAWL